MHIYLDSSPENMTSELALEAAGILQDRWNGWVRPLATAAAFSRFLEAWKANDPNGTWGTAGIVGNRLAYTPSDSADTVDEFPALGRDLDGRRLFDLTGWVWVAHER